VSNARVTQVAPVTPVEAVEAIEPGHLRATYFFQIEQWRILSEEQARTRKAKAAATDENGNTFSASLAALK